MLAFVPYVGFTLGLLVAMGMAILDWQGPGTLVGVVAVMAGVQIIDGMVITPRIVGRSVGLAPLEVILTMMAAGSLFGFLGVLLAVPLGAVAKILIQRGVKRYLTSEFYNRSPGPSLTPLSVTMPAAAIPPIPPISPSTKDPTKIGTPPSAGSAASAASSSGGTTPLVAKSKA
jgi:hypothetical protein